LPEKALGFRVQEYGFRQFSDLFTKRQIIALDTFASCVAEMHEVIKQDALAAGREADDISFADRGRGARAYADAITTLLGICIGKLAQSNNTLVRWFIDPRNGSGKATPAFDRHAIPVVWDFVEVNPFGQSTGDWSLQVETALRALALVDPYGPAAEVRQADARSLHLFMDRNIAVATDPPYFANIGYADVSDFFYIWLRRALKNVYPALFATLATPKESELIATPYRHDGNNDAAKAYFREGFREVFSNIAKHQRPDIPISIVYAFKQEEEDDLGTASTGWDAMLEGLIASDLSVVGTWPLRTNRATRMIGIGTNALASAILILCRVRPADAPITTRRELAATLKKELPGALAKLQQGNIAPVDFAQAAIGPGMSIFSRYSKVLEADGSSMAVQTALQMINIELERFLEVLEGEMDRDTRFCITWFEQYGLEEALFGEADVLARAKNTAVQGLVEAGVVYAKAGKVRLLKRSEYPEQWTPSLDHRVTVWECTQHLIQRLNTGGEDAAARLVNQLGSRSEDARALAYRLYSICERKKWADEALAYNTLVVEWPVIQDKAAQSRVMPTEQTNLFG
jgi:putative DNA methylase